LQGRFHQCLLLVWEGTNEQNLQHGLRLLSQALQEQVPPEDPR
jgi:hypothetical protein